MTITEASDEHSVWDAYQWKCDTLTTALTSGQYNA